MLISKWKILTEVRIYEEETISCHLATSLQYTKNKEKLEQGVIDKISRDRVSKDKDSCCRFYHADIVQSNNSFQFLNSIQSLLNMFKMHFIKYILINYIKIPVKFLIQIM